MRVPESSPYRKRDLDANGVKNAQTEANLDAYRRAAEPRAHPEGRSQSVGRIE
jgi:hypothetical protein